MLAKDLTSEALVPVKTSDSAMLALNMMEDLKVAHLPIVNNVEFLGLIAEDDILTANTPDEPIGNHRLSMIRPFVNDSQHIFEVIRIFSELNLTILPVLDAKNNYLGCITLADLIQNLSRMTSLDNPGGIIVLELNQNDYSLTEIAQIVESNDAKVLCLYLTSYGDTTKVDITLKINKMDISSVLSTFNRYNYIVKASFTEHKYIEDLKDRFDLLMNYLNM